MNIKVPFLSTLNLGVLRLESVLVLDKICGKDYLLCFFCFYFSKMYFYCKIESIWVILVLLVNWDKIFFQFSSFWLVLEDGMKNAGFSRLVFIQASITVCHCLWKTVCRKQWYCIKLNFGSQNTANNSLLKNDLTPSAYFCTSNI